jgi:hypothetical protein
MFDPDPDKVIVAFCVILPVAIREIVLLDADEVITLLTVMSPAVV